MGKGRRTNEETRPEGRKITPTTKRGREGWASVPVRRRQTAWEGRRSTRDGVEATSASSLHRDQLVFLGKRLQLEVLEVDLLRNSVRVELEADWSFLDPVGLGVAPVDDLCAVDGDAHAVALGEDLQVVPVVLLADLLGRGGVDRQAVAAVQDRKS